MEVNLKNNIFEEPKMVKDIQGINPDSAASNRKWRRNMLKGTGYFKSKKNLNFVQKGMLVEENLKKGSEKHVLFVDKNNKDRVEKFIDKELSIRKHFETIGMNVKQIDALIDSFYSVWIKDDSPLISMYEHVK